MIAQKVKKTISAYMTLEWDNLLDSVIPPPVYTIIDSRVTGIGNSFFAGRNYMYKYRELKLVVRESAFASPIAVAMLFCIVAHCLYNFTLLK